MNFKAFASTALVASLSFSPVSPFLSPARADNKDIVAGLIIGGIIGGAIASEQGKSKKKSSAKSKSKSKAKSSKSAAPSMSPEERAANIEVQEALNQFGWQVGAADGAIGPKSRAAISEYQAFMGFPVTGELTEQQRTILVTAYYRVKAGGSAISEIVSASVHGLRGVLIAQAEDMEGGKTEQPGSILANEPVKPADIQPGSVKAAVIAALPELLPKSAEEPAAAGAAAPVKPVPKLVVAAAPDPAPEPEPQPEPPPLPEPEPVPAPEPAPEPAPQPEPMPVPEPEPAPVEAKDETGASGPGLPTFLAAKGGKEALVKLCNMAGAKTAANGGPMTAETLTDPALALSEQFCLARSEAIAQSNQLIAEIAGFTPDEIAQQCEGFGPLLAPHVATLAVQPMSEVLNGLRGFVQTSGMAPEQLAGTARVCLGVGYGRDKVDLALGAALLLTSLGEGGYAELAGHHLVHGIGTAKAPGMAAAWYEAAAAAMASGDAVFAAATPGRDALILQAARSLAGGPLPAPGNGGDVQEAALPTFSVAPDTASESEPVQPVSSPSLPAAQGPGADALRMSAEIARIAVQGPLMMLGVTDGP